MDAGSISAIPRYSIFIALLLLGGAYFAAAETAFASVSKIRMISDADDGDARAEKVLYILDHFDKALITLLIGTNVMHIGCSSVATLFASKMWGNRAVTLCTFVTAFVVFIFAEMIPKTYAKTCCEALAPRLAPSLLFLMKVLTPVSILFSFIGRLVTRLVGSDGSEEPTVSEEELFDIIEGIDEEDKIDEDAAELVQSALEFTVKTVRLALTPWEKAVKIRRSMSDEEILELITDGHYSRIPVVDEDGSVVGILHIRKYLKAKIRGRKSPLSRSMLDAPFWLPLDMPIDDALNALSSNRAHMALVSREDGSIAGIVTVEDILEELVGEIYDEEEGGLPK